jgi:hypothetical protein
VNLWEIWNEELAPFNMTFKVCHNLVIYTIYTFKMKKWNCNTFCLWENVILKGANSSFHISHKFTIKFYVFFVLYILIEQLNRLGPPPNIRKTLIRGGIKKIPPPPPNIWQHPIRGYVQINSWSVNENPLFYYSITNVMLSDWLIFLIMYS